jgi:hypothetical protein
MDSIPLPILVSALGGAVAALFLRAFFKFISKLLVELKPLAAYGCADSPSKRPGILIGIVSHGKGRKVDDKRAINKRAWEHSLDPAEANRMHTIYGPYVNDFGKPGFYKVRFRIYGEGFSDDESPVVILDVIQRPVFMKDDDLVLLGQRVVRAKDLSPKYKGFDVYCYVAGSGTYEYRCLVIAESFEPDKHRLRFDVIRVYNHVPGWDIF